MAQFTKKGIMDSFVELAKEMPIDKITIKKVCDNCGINRNITAYNFHR